MCTGGEVNEALDTLLYFGSDDAALLEDVTTLHDTVAYGVDLVEALDGADLGIEQYLEYEGDTFLMGRQISIDLLLLSVGELHLDEGTVDADALYTALSQYALVGHVVQFIFDGRTSAVQYQYFHRMLLFIRVVFGRYGSSVRTKFAGMNGFVSRLSLVLIRCLFSLVCLCVLCLA